MPERPLLLRFLLPLLAFFAAALTQAGAQTGEAVKTGHARSRLVAETTAAIPGETLWVALAQELDEGWHVYWKNPGDSGLPLELDWRLPEGWQAGGIRYPLPHKLPLGPLTNFGHEGSPTFLVPVAVPESAEPGSAVTLEVSAKWLICLDICIPETADLSLTIPVAETAGPARAGARIRAAKSALPRDLGLDARFAEKDGAVVLAVEGAPSGEAFFFPSEGGMVEPSAPQPQHRADGILYLNLTPGIDYRIDPPDTLGGVIVLSQDGEEVGVDVTAARDSGLSMPAGASFVAPAGAGMQDAPGSDGGTALLGIFLLALLGGLVLNAMPCVFPIVFLKAAGIAQLSGAKAQVVRKDAYAYTAGVLVTFAAMAGLLLALRAAGAQLGWGFQLQSPVAVGVFAVVIFLIGLNLAGLFELGSSAQGVGQGLTGRKGPAGSFFTGLLAVMVAAPCIGPFLGLPIGYALTAPPAAAVAVFLALGLGLALPYLLLAAAPGLAGRLPRPGPWMVRLKQLFSFAMFGTVVWLVWVLSLQAGAQGVLTVGIALVAAAFAGWLFGLTQASGGKALRAGAAAAIALAFVPVFTLAGAAPAAGFAETGKLAYDEETLASLLAEGTPVFVDFTAAWCVTCQYNKRVVLETRRVKDLFARTGTVLMVADLTNPDPVITAAIERQGRSGVPLYLYYKGTGAPEVLPQILTAERLEQALEDDA